MSISGIDRIVYGVEDLEACKRFWLDWGLKLVREDSRSLDFETINGCEIFVRHKDDPSLPPNPLEEGPTVRQVIWSADSDASLDHCRSVMKNAPGFAEADGVVTCIDPIGLAIGVRKTKKRPVEVSGAQANTIDKASRVDEPSPNYERAEPVEAGHIVFFTDKLDEATAFYKEIGFKLSDSYPGYGNFLRTSDRGGHHNLFYLQLPNGKIGLNHVAFKVRDIHEVFGGGMQMSRCGWKTQLGPGKHPISSAFFWYFHNPNGALVEYYADEDILTEAWEPREFKPGPTVYADWAITGGIDGNTRRQASAGEAPSSRFVSETKS
jgi:catechol 2,3-dioxygenase-like lactoylglutathione lyase family enzyme